MRAILLGQETPFPNGLTLGDSFEITLNQDSWQENSQTVSDDRFLAAEVYNYIVGPVSTSYTEYTNNGVRADNVPSDGSMTFVCNKEPTKELVVEILRLEVQNG